MQKLNKILGNLAAKVVGLYQVLLSPDHSWLAARFPYGYCKFYPSCSQYSKESLLKFGLIKGVFLSVKRLVSCHPWASPKVDLVPQK